MVKQCREGTDDKHQRQSLECQHERGTRIGGLERYRTATDKPEDKRRSRRRCVLNRNDDPIQGQKQITRPREFQKKQCQNDL